MTQTQKSFRIAKQNIKEHETLLQKQERITKSIHYSKVGIRKLKKGKSGSSLIFFHQCSTKDETCAQQLT